MCEHNGDRERNDSLLILELSNNLNAGSAFLTRQPNLLQTGSFYSVTGATFSLSVSILRILLDNDGDGLTQDISTRALKALNSIFHLGLLEANVINLGGCESVVDQTRAIELRKFSLVEHLHDLDSVVNGSISKVNLHINSS